MFGTKKKITKNKEIDSYRHKADVYISKVYNKCLHCGNSKYTTQYGVNMIYGASLYPDELLLKVRCSECGSIALFQENP